ncbi:hypothetical protein ACN28S_38795 [Cystobacter fuscus]
MGSKSDTKSWGEQWQAELLARGRKAVDVEKKREVPTLKEFAPRFIDRDARANRQKPSTISSKESLLRLYLLPRFGERRLDEVTNEDIQRLKAELRDLSTKTVNNVLTVFNRPRLAMRGAPAKAISRSWRATRASPPRSGTCTSRPRRRMRPSA